jgi:tetratricopeptide (TPR) repeat protein
LLKLEDLPLPHAGGLLLRLGESDGLTRAIEGLSGKVGTLEVDWVAKFVEALRKWFEAGLPTVTGTAYSSGSGEVTVRLTYRRRDRRISGVSASTKPETGVDAARLSAERAVFRMYYWLDEPDAVEAEVESAAGLREGLALLQRYVDGEPAAVLDEARRKFSDARSAVPGLWEASLYEGIALDLLERHDDALLRFEYVEKNATDPALREKALYNQAVAHMRKYRPRELKRACELFAQVTGSRPDALHEPVKVLAKAGKATAVAHYPIFWEKLLHDRKAVNDQERSAWKRADVGRVFAWLRQVEAIAKEVDRDLAAIRNAAESAWDEKARRQLEWGKWDAAGNVYLNLVTGFLQPPCPDEFDTVKEDRERFLRIALEDFRKSELLLRPGVETLSNIGTAYLYLGRYEDARRYLDDVIKLNPEYEYAVYRKAQSWDRENRPQKVREVLNGHKKSVRIEEFRQLFEKYEVALPE